jgi:LmbE family N-acetylglucosaminyl deacetylase
MFDALYLSPHFDDAVLSCGAQIYDRARHGEQVAVATVCAAPPPDSLSPFAEALHARWKEAGDFDRALEDRQALGILGAALIHLPFHDCIYRRSPDGEWLYASEAAIFGPVSPLEAGLVDSMAGAFEQIRLAPDAIVFAPRAIGNHVDHQVVRAAGERWCRARGRPLRHYAEFPYAESVPGGEVVQVSEAGRGQKTRAIRAYRSQISTFWDDDRTMDTKVSQWEERTF